MGFRVYVERTNALLAKTHQLLIEFDSLQHIRFQLKMMKIISFRAIVHVAAAAVVVVIHIQYHQHPSVDDVAQCDEGDYLQPTFD